MTRASIPAPARSMRSTWSRLAMLLALVSDRRSASSMPASSGIVAYRWSVIRPPSSGASARRSSASSRTAAALPSVRVAPLSTDPNAPISRRSYSRVAGRARGGRIGVDCLGQLEDLLRQVDQLLVLAVLLQDRLPLLVGEDLALRIGPVLADHHERREEDRLEGDDHREQAVGVVLDLEDDPAREPD